MSDTDGTTPAGQSPVDIGSRRELFVDHLLIQRLKKAFLYLHEPQPREIVLRHDTPWEGPFALYHTVIHHEGRYLLYYRGWPEVEGGAVYCVAQSEDGIHFQRPRLGRHAWQGDRSNNIILAEEPFTHTFAPFLDTRPGVPPEERFKALSRNLVPADGQDGHRAVLSGFASGDGIEWRRIGPDRLIEDGAFDSQNVAFWSEAEGRYVSYYRTFSTREGIREDRRGPTTTARNLRRIKRATSADFHHWEPGVVMDYRTGGRPAPVEEFYINQTRPYFRAPHIYVALPARFMAGRRAITEAEAAAIGVHETQKDACSDACFMTARPGAGWYDRTFMEAFIKPPVGPEHWSARCNYPVDGVVQTGPEEMSLYVDERYAQPGNRVRRYSLRLDGFVSVRAPHGGGELLTRPLLFSGRELELNFATSAAGSLRVEIRAADGRPVPGYSLRDAVDLFGNRLEGRARWRHGADVSALAGKPVQLRFVLRDADVYSLRFVP